MWNTQKNVNEFDNISPFQLIVVAVFFRPTEQPNSVACSKRCSKREEDRVREEVTERVRSTKKKQATNAHIMLYFEKQEAKKKGQRKTTYCKIDSLNGANCKAFVAHIASAA